MEDEALIDTLPEKPPEAKADGVDHTLWDVQAKAQIDMPDAMPPKGKAERHLVTQWAM